MLRHKTRLLSVILISSLWFNISLADQATLQKIPTTCNNVDSLTQPNISATSLLVWANEAAVSAYTYDFVNYQKQLQAASQYFTPDGWKNFQEALDKSGSLTTAISKKMVVSAVATGAPVILSVGVVNGTYSWVVQMPMLITYQSASENKPQNIIAKMKIIRTSPYIGTRGIGIDQFVATVRPSRLSVTEPKMSPDLLKG